jgi:hypothetical protein
MWRKILMVNYFLVYVKKKSVVGHYETGRTGESQYITLPADDDLLCTTKHFVLSLMLTLLRFHCLLLITTCNFKLFQYVYFIISHVLHTTNSVLTDPPYYHNINR